MPDYSHRPKRRSRLPRRVFIALLILLVVLVGSTLVVRRVYTEQLRPVSSSQQTQSFTVENGDSVKVIAANLEKANLIRSAWAFELYVHSKEVGSSLQAGTYTLSPSLGTEEIISILSNGKVSTKLVTILPGQRIAQIRTTFIDAGFSPTSVDAALQPSQYKDLPIMAFKPANVNTLEGLLWPDSFQKTDQTDPSTIIRESLVAMGKQITPDIQAAFAREGLTTYEGITLTSIVTQEVSKPADQVQVAQVFLSRLKLGMMLGSDVTANYGAVAAGKTPDLTYDSPYNTLIHSGLPPTPISTITKSALIATTNPAATNWLYFVTGDDGTTYFSTNFQDHQAYAQKYCHKLCGE